MNNFKPSYKLSSLDIDGHSDYKKKERLLKRAQAESDGKTVETKKLINVKYGLNHVTYLIEQNKAQLVVIAHDVDPIELVVWLPALCRKMEIPYCIVKGKTRLGTIVHKKTASVLCLTTVKNEDKMEFSRILEAIKANFNDKYEEYRKITALHCVASGGSVNVVDAVRLLITAGAHVSCVDADDVAPSALPSSMEPLAVEKRTGINNPPQFPMLQKVKQEEKLRLSSRSPICSHVQIDSQCSADKFPVINEKDQEAPSIASSLNYCHSNKSGSIDQCSRPSEGVIESVPDLQKE
ncbi:60S ribosomal protein L7a-1, variant 2 [Lathyrus oleraceus]|uniref:60S ribosomal protein L7a n=2 Tax=Pisum sativum TaxID=3888 RepID=A0A9D4WBS2_PEA|nr:60S ribosomal protein L7a-1, variant 2 [Pisum sativum]